MRIRVTIHHQGWIGRKAVTIDDASQANLWKAWRFLDDYRSKHLEQEGELCLEPDTLDLPVGHRWEKVKAQIYIHPGERLEECMRKADDQLSGPASLTSPVFFDDQVEEEFTRAAFDLLWKAMIADPHGRSLPLGGWPDLAD